MIDLQFVLDRLLVIEEQLAEMRRLIVVEKIRERGNHSLEII